MAGGGRRAQRRHAGGARPAVGGARGDDAWRRAWDLVANGWGFLFFCFNFSRSRAKN